MTTNTEALARIVEAAKKMHPWFTEKADSLLERIKVDTHDDVMLYHDAVSVLVAARDFLRLVTQMPVPAPPTDDEREALATQYAREHGDSRTRIDFLAGYDAGHRHRGPITGDEIEAAAQALFEDPATPGDGYTWAEMVCEDPERADIWRADARRVLEAAEAARTNHTNGSRDV